VERHLDRRQGLGPSQDRRPRIFELDRRHPGHSPPGGPWGKDRYPDIFSPNAGGGHRSAGRQDPGRGRLPAGEDPAPPPQPAAPGPPASPRRTAAPVKSATKGEAGRAEISAAVPRWTTRPRSTTASRLASSAASSKEWVTRTTGAASSAKTPPSSRIASRRVL